MLADVASGFRDPVPRAAQALTPREQRRMHDAIPGMERMGPDPGLPEHPELWILRWSLRLLCLRRLEAMEREGRTGELHDLLRRAFGDGGPG